MTSMPVPKHFGHVESFVVCRGGCCEFDGSAPPRTIRNRLLADLSGVPMIEGANYIIVISGIEFVERGRCYLFVGRGRFA
jgi:hypothetical protein